MSFWNKMNRKKKKKSKKKKNDAHDDTAENSESEDTPELGIDDVMMKLNFRAKFEYNANGKNIPTVVHRDGASNTEATDPADPTDTAADAETATTGTSGSAGDSPSSISSTSSKPNTSGSSSTTTANEEISSKTTKSTTKSTTESSAKSTSKSPPNSPSNAPNKSVDNEAANASNEGGFAWQPRRNNINDHERSQSSDYGESKTKERSQRSRDRERDAKEADSNDTDIDANLMGMYRRGFELQLNKMHFASDAVYEQIMEDISRNGISQSDIYHKYHIDFIPDESSFKLVPPPNVVEDEEQKLRDRIHSAAASRWRSQFPRTIESMERKLGGDGASKRAFKNFYALTRMQQKYLGPNDRQDAPQQNESEHPTTTSTPMMSRQSHSEHIDVVDVLLNDDDDDDEDFDDGKWAPIRDKLDKLDRIERAQSPPDSDHSQRGDRGGSDGDGPNGHYHDDGAHYNDHRGYYTVNAPKWGNLTESMLSDEDIENINVLRSIQQTVPLDVLHVLLNDDKIPQWLYESDTILDLNCGIADSLIYLLHNFTTIRGICVVGNNGIKSKYATLNVAAHGLTDRIEVVQRDLYDPYVVSRFNASDVVFLDWYGGDEDYLEYLISTVMNDHEVRSAKLGRVLLSFNRLLFSESTFQASYTLHFAANWKLDHVQPTPLKHDVSLYMYSIPFYLSKLSNLYVQNYQVFYGFHPMFTDLGFKFDFQGNTIAASNKSREAWPSWAAWMYPAMAPNGEEANASDSDHPHQPHHYHQRPYPGDMSSAAAAAANRCGLDPDLKPSVKSSGLLGYDAADYAHLNNAMFRKISAMSMSVDTMTGDSEAGGGGASGGKGTGTGTGSEDENTVRNGNRALSAEDEEAIFEILGSGMRVSEIGEISEFQKLWNVISSQLLYQAFINGIQSVIRKDVENENSQVLIAILNSIKERHLELELEAKVKAKAEAKVAKESGNGKSGADGDRTEGVGQKQQQQQQHDEWEYLEGAIFEIHRIDSCALYHYILDEWGAELTALLNEFRDLFFYESVRDSVELKKQSLLDCI